MLSAPRRSRLDSFPNESEHGHVSSRFRDIDEMTPEQRRAEIANILGRALRRVLERDQSPVDQDAEAACATQQKEEPGSTTKPR